MAGLALISFFSYQDYLKSTFFEFTKRIGKSEFLKSIYS